MTGLRAITLYQSFCKEHVGMEWLPIQGNEILQGQFAAWIERYQRANKSLPIGMADGEIPEYMQGDLPEICDLMERERGCDIHYRNPCFRLAS